MFPCFLSCWWVSRKAVKVSKVARQTPYISSCSSALWAPCESSSGGCSFLLVREFAAWMQRNGEITGIGMPDICAFFLSKTWPESSPFQWLNIQTSIPFLQLCESFLCYIIPFFPPSGFTGLSEGHGQLAMLSFVWSLLDNPTHNFFSKRNSYSENIHLKT